jgi:restriction system protein
MTFFKTKDAKDVNLQDTDMENDGVDTPDEIQSWRDKLKMFC